MKRLECARPYIDDCFSSRCRLLLLFPLRLQLSFALSPTNKRRKQSLSSNECWQQSTVLCRSVHCNRSREKNETTNHNEIKDIVQRSFQLIRYKTDLRLDDDVNILVKFNRFKMLFRVEFSSSRRAFVNWSCRIYSIVRRRIADFWIYDKTKKKTKSFHT